MMYTPKSQRKERRLKSSGRPTISFTVQTKEDLLQALELAKKAHYSFVRVGPKYIKAEGFNVAGDRLVIKVAQ